MRFLKYLLIMTSTLLVTAGISAITIVAFDSFIVYMSSWLFMVIGLLVLFVGLMFSTGKEKYGLKSRLFLVHAIGFFLLHLTFAHENSFSMLEGFYPLLSILTIVGYNKMIGSNKLRTTRRTLIN